MSTWDWILVLVVGYWTLAWLHIKGNDPFASRVFHVIWVIIKVPLMLIGGILLLAALVGASSGDK